MLLAIFSDLIFDLSAFHFSLISDVSGFRKSRAQNVVSKFQVQTHFIFLASLVRPFVSSASYTVSVLVVKLNYVPTRNDSMECFSICFKF